jgi:hypothetical protein
MQLFGSYLLNSKESPDLRCNLTGKTAIITGAFSGLDVLILYLVSKTGATFIIDGGMMSWVGS